MNNGLIGIERDVVLASLVSDKAPLMVRPLVSHGERVETMTLKFNQYRIFSQGILFFQQVLPQWYKISKWQASTGTDNDRQVHISFFYRGRGLYFVSSLKRVQNGYALVVPQEVIKMTDFNTIHEDGITAKVYYPEYATVHAQCCAKEGFNLFENRLWSNFPKKETIAAEKYFEQIAGLKRADLPKNCLNLIERTKLILYIPDKKIPDRNYFPYTATVTTADVDFSTSAGIESELKATTYDTYIPLASSPSESIHSIFGLKTKMVVTSPMDIYETLLLLPVCRFFIEDNKAESPIQGRAEPLSILCLTDSAIVLGGINGNAHANKKISQSPRNSFPLQQGLEYTLQLVIPLATIKRLIKITMLVSHLFQNDKGRVCALCRFTNLQEEDRRFLYEKFTGALCK